MKPENMTREQLEEVARCAEAQARAWCEPTRPWDRAARAAVHATHAALNPSPLPSDEELYRVYSGRAYDGNAEAGRRRIYAHALRLAANQMDEWAAAAPAPVGTGYCADASEQFHAWADEMVARK